MSGQGFGKKSQDWSYLSPRRLLYQQDALITDPEDIPESAIIDTTVNAQGAPTDRARQQTLVAYIMELPGGFLPKEAVIYLWIDGLWSERACAGPPLPEHSSSSSNWSCPPAVDVAAQNRWCLIEAVKMDNAAHDGSQAHAFPWLPAGRYKIAVGDDGSGTFIGPVAIAEQHTE
jgi:hypothetical protein